MDTQFLFADAAWFRLAVVGIDILAVVAIVRLWNAIAVWWQMPFPRRSFSMPARVRSTHTRPQRP
jgi:hypothetical protein